MLTDRKIRALHAALFQEARQRGIGSWRTPTEVADVAYDRTIDGYITGSYAAEDLQKIGKAILANLVRSGPERTEARRDAMTYAPLLERLSAGEAAAVITNWDARRRRLLRAVHAAPLSPLERAVIIAITRFATAAECKNVLGLSSRNFSTLRRRATEKLQRHIEVPDNDNLER